jgi:hypothetical protein
VGLLSSHNKFFVDKTGVACYLKNISPSLVFVNTIIHEAWIGKKPFLAHLKFSFDDYIHVPRVIEIQESRNQTNWHTQSRKGR